MKIQNALLSLLAKVEHHPERYAVGYEERIISVLEKRKKRNSKIWIWRYKQQGL